MNLQRWLQLHTALLTVLAAGFLLLSGDRTYFPWALGGGALLALWLTDWRGWVKLPRTAGNLAALAAVAWTFREFWRQSNDREAQLFTIAHMLIYLQVTLLFQVKFRRLHWQLLVLNALQIVVAAALLIGPQFGLLLAAFLTLAVGSMLLLCLQREIPEEPGTARAIRPAGSWQRLLDPPRLVEHPGEVARNGKGFRLPWLLQGTLVFSLASLAIAAAFFFTAPRLSEATWQTARGRGSVSGFSGEVLLKSKGSIRLSEQPVMRVSFSRVDTGAHVPLATEPYFHGQVLTTYRSDQYGARWSYESSYRVPGSVPIHTPEPVNAAEVVRQDIVLDWHNPPLLFAMMPVYFLPETPKDIREHRRSPKLIRQVHEDELLASREFRYSIGTLAIRHSRQVHAVPHFNSAPTLNDLERSNREREALSSFPVELLPGLKRVADDVIHSGRLEHASTLDRALALQNHLYGSGQYHYTLEFDDSLDLTSEQLALDPLERFVVHRKRGHCEYFASALVMMLRSQGIPARMVVGYKGGEWNSLGQYYLVKRKHAHAWVEVLLSADEVPADEVAGKPSLGGAWFRLDPTPMAWQGIETINAKTFGSNVTAVFDYADYLWRDYVLGLNATKQDAVLDPLTSRPRDLMSNQFALDYWQRVFKSGNKQATVKVGLGEANVATASGASRTWLALAGLFGLLILAPATLVIVGLGGKQLLGRIRHWRRAAPAESAAGIFGALKRLLARHGIDCADQATARELAEVAGKRLRLSALDAENCTRSMAAILSQIVAGYHQARFGGGKLSPAEFRTVQEALALLRRAELLRSN